jgi:5-methylcytosine-specific restriction protein A
VARSVKEWIGKSDDSKPPPRVRQRIFDASGGKCHICGLPLGGKKWEADHVLALINGGQNRESNLSPAHVPCHHDKTKKDVAQKSKTAKIKGKHTGAIQPKGQIQSKPFAKSEKRAKIDKSVLPPLSFRPMFKTKDEA